MTELAALTEKVERVSRIYAERNNIVRDDDWYLLKLQEELGELASDYLRLSGRGRAKGEDRADIAAGMADEAADLLAQTLLFCAHNGIDIEAALERKWFRYLNNSTPEITTT